MKLDDIPAVREYLARIGGEATSLRRAVVREPAGRYMRDVAYIRITPEGIKAPPDYAPTQEEASEILKAIQEKQFPQHVPARSLEGLPADTSGAWIFRDGEGKITMAQTRIDNPDGGKRYIPWTYWSDGEWRAMEPDGPMPLYGLEGLGGHAVAFVHEGAKAARSILERLTGDHPWGPQLRNAAHLGWVAGALNPSRTDWTALKGMQRVYLVADNDEEGRSAMPYISQQLPCETWRILFTDEFPAGFDLGDEFPDKMFTMGHYTGPTFRHCLHPGTWMTEPVPKEPGEKGRKAYRLRKPAKAQWLYCEESDLFVNVRMPEVVRSEGQMNRMLAPFSNVDNVARLVLKAQTSRIVKMAYRPDNPRLRITDQGSSAVNTYIPPDIEPLEGSAEPFLEFLEYMIPDAAERHEVKRWCATLIACPGVRIGYALLLISETQGIGKTTLGNRILAPLVGWPNVSFPGETDILSQFNEWIAHKRLAVINEIYTGSSWKSYHLLKSAITDNSVTVNKKHVQQYKVENWCHIFACSNSTRALKMETTDRRWYCPTLAETKLGIEYWRSLYSWLSQRGLGEIRHWAQNFGDYIGDGDNAPMSRRKEVIIEESHSAAEAEVIRLARLTVDRPEPVAFLMRDVLNWVKGSIPDKVHNTQHELRKAMASTGMATFPTRITQDGASQYIVHNKSSFLLTSALPAGGAEARTLVREHIIEPNQIFSQQI